VAGAILAWTLVLLGGHWRYSIVDARVARSGLRPEQLPDDVQDKSDRNGQMILRRLEDDKAFKAAFSTDKSKKDLSGLIGTALKAATGREPGLPAALTALRSSRHAWQPILKALRQAQAARIFSWNIRYSVPFYQVEIPHYAYLLKLNRVACAEAVLLSADGDMAGAEAQLMRAQWLADKISGMPNLIGVMIGAAMQRNIYDAATPLLKKGAGQKLLAGQEVGGLEHALVRALRRELLLGPPSVRGDFSGSLMFVGQGFATKVSALSYAPWVDWDVAGSLTNSLEALPYMEGPLPQVRQCLKDFQQRAWEGWRFQSDATPRFEDMYLRMAEITARQEIALLAQKAGAFHRSTHRWPVGFSQLPQLRELPDPFTGEPMITRIKDGHFELLSVGSDGKEDGDKPVEGTAKDIVVRL